MKIADLEIKLSADVAQLRTSMNDAAGSVRSFEEQVIKTKDAIVDFLVVKEVTSFLKEASAATEEWAFGLEKLSQLTGVTTQAAAALTAITREEGVSTETLSTVMSRLASVLATHPEKFKALGIAIRDASGAYLPLTQILENTVRGLDQFKAGTDRTAAGASLLGRGIANLLPDLERLAPRLTPPELARAAQLVEGLGLAIDENGVAKAREWEKAEADLGLAFLAIENQIGRALLPVIKDLTDKVVELVRNGDLKRWAEDGAAALLKVANAAKDLKLIMAGYTTVPDLGGETLAQLNTGLTNLEATRDRLQKQIAGGGASTDFSIKSWFGKSGLDGSKAPISDLELVKAELKEVDTEIDAYKAKLQTLSAPAGPSSVTPKPKDDGNKLFAGPPDKTTSAAADQFSKLSAEIQQQTEYQNELAAAWAKGGAAVQDLTNKEKAYEAGQRLGKGATDEMRAAIESKTLAELRASDAAKQAQQDDEDRRESIARTVEATASAANQIYAETRTPLEEYAAKIKELNDLLAQNAISQDTASRATALYQQQLDSAVEKTSGLKDSIKDVGSAFEKAFSSATTSENIFANHAAGLKKILLDLGMDLEKVVLKDPIFKPLESGLDSLLSGGSGAKKQGTSPGALPTPEGMFQVLDKGWQLLASGSTNIATAFENAFTASENALAAVFGNAFQTIGPEISSLFSSAASGLSGLFSGGGGGGGGGGGIGDLLGSGIESIGSSLFGAGGMLGFANGGSFDVGGGGGVDSQIVAFKATPGERVSVGGKGGSGSPVNVQVHNYSNQPAKVQHKRNANGGNDLVIQVGDAMAHNVRTGGAVSRAMRDTFGASRTPIQR